MKKSDRYDRGSNRRFGPHKVPRIECGKCGTSHHYDAAAGEYLGRCRECSGFLRRPTEEEHDQFTDFLVWNSQHLDRENDQTQLVADGGESFGREISQDGSYRVCRCGFEGKTTEDSCPDCGTEWFLKPEVR